ncbi:WD40-repeat-containing domain protein, partial [Syncephalis pseudoplumigaleata]
VLGLDFHPSDSLVAACLVNGLAHCFQYNMKEEDVEADDYEELLFMEHHRKSVRDIKFSVDGNALFTVSRDKSFASVDVETGKLLFHKEKAHGIAINRVHPISYNWVATGDDMGRVKIWDSRMEKVVQKYEDNEDFIADMLYVPEKKRLLVAGGDGYLSVFDVRRPDIVARSDNFEDELLSLALVKNGAKVICGSQGGILNIFHWDDWGDIKDRMPGHPSSIDTICAWDDDIVFTGSSDGLIRACHILPNKFIGCVGEHDHFPVEQIALTHDRRFLGSCSHDQSIRFWNVEAALNALMNEEDEEEEDEEDE